MQLPSVLQLLQQLQGRLLLLLLLPQLHSSSALGSCSCGTVTVYLLMQHILSDVLPPSFKL